MTEPQNKTDAPKAGEQQKPIPNAGPADAATGIRAGGKADQHKPSTTQISSTPAPSQQVETKDLLALAKKIDKNPPGSGKTEHHGEAGEGAEEVGKDTGIEPGKNVGLQTVSAEAHQKALNELDKSRTVQRNGRQKLDEAKLDSMSAQEIRAVASDRGYKDIRPGGHRSVKRAFLDAQAQDKDLDVPKK